MSLNALRAALQGLFPLTPVAAAVQGLLEELASGKHLHQDTDQGRARSAPARDYLSENLQRQQQARELARQQKEQAQYDIAHLHRDDADAVELVMALVTEGFLDGDQ